VAKASEGEIRGSGRSFYRWPGRGGRKRWRAPARLAAAAMMAHSGGDRMAQGRPWRRDGSVIVRRYARRQFVLVGELMARRQGGRWPAMNVLMADLRRGGKGLTSGARLPERERS
jgi:hypothetical protein